MAQLFHAVIYFVADVGGFFEARKKKTSILHDFHTTTVPNQFLVPVLCFNQFVTDGYHVLVNQGSRSRERWAYQI